MFGDQGRVYSRLLLAADVVGAVLALACSYYARTFVRFIPDQWGTYFHPELLPLRNYFFYFMVFLPVWLILLFWTQRYSGILYKSLGLQTVRVLQFLVVTGLSLTFFPYTLKLEISRLILFAFLICSGVLMVFNRLLFRWVLTSRNINEHNQTNLLIVGTDERARQLGRSLERFRRWGFHVVGYISTEAERKPSDAEPILGTIHDLQELILRGTPADEIIFVGSDLAGLAALEDLIQLCGELGIRTRVAADFFPSSTSRISTDFLDGLPLITFSVTPDHSLALVAKRLIDFLVAWACLTLLSPLVLITAVAVKVTTPGPVFYRQIRCGRFGRRFTLVKFRTMIDGAEDKLWEIRHLNEMSGPVFKMRHDPRVTSLGRFLRKFSIDEIPQFWNVMKGEMSIVGPRAPIPEEVAHYSIRQRRRLSVKPGITCLWQISGRSEVDFQKWMDLDLKYIDNWSLFLDLYIMWRTIPAVFLARGAS